MDSIVHGVAKSQSRLSDFHFHFHHISYSYYFPIISKHYYFIHFYLIPSKFNTYGNLSNFCTTTPEATSVSIAATGGGALIARLLRVPKS